MAGQEQELPLFPLGLVALPHEAVPLHIFEERYKTMIGECLEQETEFGIVWASEDGLKATGCACVVEDVLERAPDGRLNIICRGTRPFRLLEEIDDRPYPAGRVAWAEDKAEELDAKTVAAAREAYGELVELATDEPPDAAVLAEMDAYAMAATVEFGLDAKQGLLDLRSENARLRLVARLFRAAIKRLDFIERAQARARSNGKVRFG
jgi:Lon protease-like protein